MEDQFERYAIPIDGRWNLEDLYRFPRAYEQVYFALEALVPAETPEAEERVQRAFQAYPWRGGYSAVDFYDRLKQATPPQRRPQIERIHYASPGLIELYLNLPLAIQIGSMVASLAGSIGVCNKVYHSIHSDLQKRKLLRLDVERRQMELTRDELQMVVDMSETMARMLDLGSAYPIHERTKNPLVSLKILLSFYRRLRLLAEYKIKGKADIRSIDQMVNDGDL